MTDLSDYRDSEMVSDCCNAGIDIDIPICQECGEWAEPVNLEEDE